MKLPKLPKFDGDVLKWTAFWHAFRAEVHADHTMSNTRKFNFLHAQLGPKVQKGRGGLTASDDNYPILVQKLTKRYGRTQKIIYAHVRALFNLIEPSENLESLRAFCDDLDSHVQSLEALGKSPDSYQEFLACLVLDKLPPTIRGNFTRAHPDDEWTPSEINRCLEAEIRVLEDQVGKVPQFHSYSTQVAPVSSTTFKRKPCVFCTNDQHSSAKCNVIGTVEERMKFVTQRKLCNNCLRSGHQSKDCQSKFSCRVQGCGSRHHSALHQDKSKSSTASVNSIFINILTKPIAFNLSSIDKSAHDGVTLLKTAVANVRSHFSQLKANLLLDEGSQRSFISQKLADALKLRPAFAEYLMLSKFASEPENPELYHVVSFAIIDKLGKSIYIQAICLDHLVNPLDNSSRKAIASIAHLKGLDLAHPLSNEKVFNVDILIGGCLLA